MRVYASLLALLLASCARSPSPPAEEGAPSFVPQPADGFLEQFTATGAFRLGRPASIRITPKGDAVLFLRSGPRSFERDLWTFDPSTGEERVLLTAQQILEGGEERLTAEELARRERQRLAARGIASYQLSADGSRILVPLSGRLFVIERETRAVVELPSDGGSPIDPRFSPDGSRVAVVRDGDLYVIDVARRTQRRLTEKRSPTVTNGLAEFVAQEEMDRMEGHWWSPDGRFLAFEEADTFGVESMHIADPFRPEREPASWPYPRPGKKNVQVRLGIVGVDGGETRWVDWNRDRFPYLATVRWEKDAPLTLLVQNRLQSAAELLAVDAATGGTRTLLAEKDPAWLNLDQSVPRWVDGNSFLWSTEREGRWQLELRDRSGALVRRLTPPELGYRRLLHVEADAKTAWVVASPEPTEEHLFRISLAGEEEPGAITVDPGHHDAVFAGESGDFVHSLSSASGELRWAVRRKDGTSAGVLRSVAEVPPFLPEVELLTLPGEAPLRAAVVRPRNFDPRFRYPVVVFVYGGPLAQVVTSPRERWLRQQWVADHGFIVVSVDGRGTPGRGRQWERAIHRNLIDVPLEDQVRGLQALGARIGGMDLGRVGIFGWSFGGYFTSMAVMRRPDVFHAGVAVAPVADWLDYDTHYTERYLDLPESNPEGYEKSSVLTYAKDLSRPLLLVHGTADDNVYFSQALKISDVLFRHGKEHEFLPLAGFTHAVHEPLAAQRLYQRMVDSFLEHLGRPIPLAP